MDALGAFWHVLNLFFPAVLTGALAAGLAKLAWRRDLAATRFADLAGPACAACAAVVLLGLVAFGRDGRMATYGAMVLAAALTLWWRGFGPGRK
jgi:hypothetical protein